MFTLDQTNTIVLGRDIVMMILAVVSVFGGYLLSRHIFGWLTFIMRKIGEKTGTFSVSREYRLQLYVYQHRNSLIAKLYYWINEQLIALNFKRQGVTVVGYFIFWSFVSIILGVLIIIILDLSWFSFPAVYAFCITIVLVLTRVFVSERIIKRENEVMNAIDLIVPELDSGVYNAIVQYRNNFNITIRPDFEAFISNIQDRGMSFESAMTILADNLGYVFNDFAQKAIYYEAIGDREMLIIFNELTETNRLRRQLRNENESAFIQLKTSFIVSSLMTGGYFLFVIFTDDFSRYFFLENGFGKVLLLIMISVVFLVLSYISMIKSKNI